MQKDTVRFVKNYVKGQIILSAILTVLYSLGFGLAGLPYGYAIGALTGFFSWIPFVGTLIGLFVAMIVVAFHFTWPLLFKVTGVYLVCQLLEGFVLGPKILGGSVGLSFWQSLGAILVGTLLFPPWGTVLAVPVAAFLKFMLETRAKNSAKSVKGGESFDSPKTST